MSGCSLLQVHAYPLPQLREQASVQHAPVAVQPLLELPDMDSLAPMQLQVWALGFQCMFRCHTGQLCRCHHKPS